MENHEKTLTESISDAKMEFERLQALLSEKEAEMKREEILKKHTTPITFLEGRGRWTTRVNGKQKTLKSRKELEDWIVSQYSETATAKTLDDIAEAWFSIDEKLKSWIVYVGVEGELLPVGRTINGGLERFVYCKFNTRGKAIDWIKSKPNKLKYDKDLIVE